MEQRVYSTRRYVRLLEQTMESLSLAEDWNMELITVHMSFDEMPNSSGPAKEETALEVESKNTDKSESNNNNTNTKVRTALQPLPENRMATARNCGLPAYVV